MIASAVAAGLLASKALLVTAQNSTTGSGSRNDSAACAALMQSASQMLPNLTINTVEYVPAGTNYNDTQHGGFDPTVAYNISEHCRFSANISTSNMSSVRFEVWLPPASAWNENFLMVGNGGDNGYVQYDAMVVPLGKYGFATASTNTGHDGDGGDGTFAVKYGAPGQYDFGYRAVHLTTVYSKMLVDMFYGKNATYNYWLGCSSGGKQGLKEIQMFPEDYDAAIVGSPAYNWAWLNGWTQYVNTVINPVTSPGYIKPPSWATIHQEVLAQCDMNDGLNDSIILEPGKCFLDFSKFACGGNSTVLNSTTCLSAAQVTTLKGVYTNWTDPSTGQLLFAAFNPGSEYFMQASVNGVPYGPAPSFFLYQVLNETQIVEPVDYPNLTVNGVVPNETVLIQLATTGNNTDPGMTKAVNPDLSPFFSRGGKLMMYVGGADWLIPTNSSWVYHKSVLDRLGNTTDNLQFYEIPGMGHCSGGSGAYNFGQASQQSTIVGGTGQSSVFDAQHDMLLALRAWRENGTRPETLIGAAYKNGNISNGVAFTRKLCPWPMVGRYNGTGDPNDEASFECKM